MYFTNVISGSHLLETDTLRVKYHSAAAAASASPLSCAVLLTLTLWESRRTAGKRAREGGGMIGQRGRIVAET